MAIPKKIHWCWLSCDPIPDKIQDCIKSWKRIMPDYEIVLWDMNRFDIHRVKFVEDACAARKWAFAADYIRCYALYTEGGIYLDSDVMVYRRLDNLLECSAFSGVVRYPAEIRLSDNSILNVNWFLEAEMIGAEKNHPFFKACLDHYETKAVFQMNEEKKVICETIPGVMTRIAYEQFGLNPHASIRKKQKLKAGIVIYPPTVLGCIWLAVNMQTYAVHLCMLSWGNKTIRESSLQKIYEQIRARYRLVAMFHILRKKIWRKITSR
ncbi:MAG: polysaccharide biosynthesis protein [Dysgonamonadaceae bacterium]|jgi:hypothetical protein|nr:polysaccharide biosynthesis protein [Dysgonamonadaceae bacterium]